MDPSARPYTSPSVGDILFIVLDCGGQIRKRTNYTAVSFDSLKSAGSCNCPSPLVLFLTLVKLVYGHGRVFGDV
jgi:hypothetical protein